MAHTRPQRIAFSRREFAQMTGISEHAVQRLTSTGKIRMVRLGHRIVIPAYELERLTLIAPSPTRALGNAGSPE